jgi:hypothetical protein
LDCIKKTNFVRWFSLPRLAINYIYRSIVKNNLRVNTILIFRSNPNYYTMNTNKAVICAFIMMVIMAASCTAYFIEEESEEASSLSLTKRERLLLELFQRASSKTTTYSLLTNLYWSTILLSVANCWVKYLDKVVVEIIRLPYIYRSCNILELCLFDVSQYLNTSVVWFIHEPYLHWSNT